jgi:hypothetical protein
MPVQTQIQQRRGTAASWTSTNPTLAAGEIGFETDTNRFKIGTGSTAWTSLNYWVQDPVTTKGDLYTFSTTDARLPVGANDTVLTADSSTATGLKWAAPTGMTNPMTTTGDIIYSSSGSTPARRGIGSTGQVLTVSGGLPTWATPAGGTISWTQVGTSSSTGASVTISSLGSYDQFMIIMNDLSSTNANAELYLRFNSDTGSNYFMTGVQVDGSGSNTFSSSARTYCSIALMGNNATNIAQSMVLVSGAKSTGQKFAQVIGGGNGTGYANLGVCRYAGSSAITSITYLFDSGTIDAGTVTVYGGNA